MIVPRVEAPPRRILHARAGDAEGWLVIDTLRDGLAFGGTRFSPSVDEAEVKGLARAMTWKLAVHGQPVGGAKAGIRCRPSAPGVERIYLEMGRKAPRTQRCVLHALLPSARVGASGVQQDGPDLSP